MTERAFHRSQAELLPQRPAPITSVGVIGWMRANLFSSWLSAALTLAAAALIALIVPSLSTGHLSMPPSPATGATTAPARARAGRGWTSASISSSTASTRPMPIGA